MPVTTQNADDVAVSGNSDDLTEGSTQLLLTVAERAKLAATSGTNTGDQDLSGYIQKTVSFVTASGTTYTTSDSDNGKIILLTNAAACTVTIHSAAAAGFNVGTLTKKSAQDIFAAGGTGTLTNYYGHTKSAGNHAVCSLVVTSNAGTAPQVTLTGQTDA